MKVKQLLNVMDNLEPVNVVLYAYGLEYASTWRDGMRTVEEVKNNLIYDGMNANVVRLSHGLGYTVIVASITK